VKEGLIANSIVKEVIEKGTEIVGMVNTCKGYVMSRCRPILDAKGRVKYVVATTASQRDLNTLQEQLQEEIEKNKRYFREVQQLRKVLLTDDLIYESEAMTKIIDTVVKVASVDCNILITGESGTGKDIVARTIHLNSRRRENHYIPVNISAIPENLLEAELFGYEEGAFTGSTKGGKMGLFEVAQGGTILLDEIGDMPLNTQVKILRAIESGEIMRLGSTKPIKLDVRILAATNRNMEAAVKQGVFRNDLYYRLDVVSINIIPLRERREDIQPLCQHFLNHFNHKYELHKKITVDAIQCMEEYSWPGNVRELKNTVERLCVLFEESQITKAEVMRILGGKSPLIMEHVKPKTTELYAQEPETVWNQYADYENKAILEVLKQTKGNISEAARQLGISRGKLYRKLQKI
jgi:transcriptional regulator with PAS, ATPase and Fis domain